MGGVYVRRCKSLRIWGFYLLCYSVFSTSEKIRFTPQETKECVHELVEKQGGEVGERGGEKKSNETRSLQAISRVLSCLHSLHSPSVSVPGLR